ncbi:MAG: bacillithiol biosynthesis deacetylase BshB1 [Bacteroidetes bacterium HGW-Bacteroidetes-12]|nr:MAG: bacillithiol biosynthesis deacetylase BshB1 [Bacteroidetes bacterium HGW-Bacteroidetes-12]
MKLDILAIGIHPDDVELSCSGTLLKHIALGKKVGILDLTHGELGSRGSAEIRLQEAKNAALIMGVHTREILNFSDGFFENNKEHQLAIIKMLRLYQPEIVLANAISDRHPDHGRASKLVSDACFYSGLRRIETEFEGQFQQHWRPKVVYHYIQDRYLKPDFVVDVTDFVDKKMEAINAYSSQFYNPESKEPETPLTSKLFMDFVKARMITLGREAGFDFAEGFVAERFIGVEDITALK